MPDTKRAQAVPAEKRPVGRPANIGGKRVQVYLDEASLAKAARLGNGNVSEGIRKALQMYPVCSAKRLIRTYLMAMR